MKKALILILWLSLAAVCLQAESVGEDNPDISFAKNLFSKLYEGDITVASDVLWDSLRVFGEDFGSEYSKLNSEKEKREYRENFIRDFKVKCDNEGVQPTELDGWSVYSESENAILIEADWYPDWLMMNFGIVNGKLMLDGVYIEIDWDYWDYFEEW